MRDWLWICTSNVVSDGGREPGTARLALFVRIVGLHKNWNRWGKVWHSSIAIRHFNFCIGLYQFNQLTRLGCHHGSRWGECSEWPIRELINAKQGLLPKTMATIEHQFELDFESQPSPIAKVIYESIQHCLVCSIQTCVYFFPPLYSVNGQWLW